MDIEQATYIYIYIYMLNGAPDACTDVCDRRSLWWTEGGQTLAGVPPPLSSEPFVAT